jgi:hypothetical protein
MKQPTSTAQLKQILTAEGIDFSRWGQGKTKTLDNLWQEIVDGETILSENPLRRTISFIQVVINREGHILIETKQELANGSTRSRNRPLSEKMQPGESVETAALRGIEQELSLPPDNVTFLPTRIGPQLVEYPSLSYPGLTTFYNVHTIEAAVTGLPDTPFTSDEQSPTDPVRKHFWHWLPEDEARTLF